MNLEMFAGRESKALPVTCSLAVFHAFYPREESVPSSHNPGDVPYLRHVDSSRTKDNFLLLLFVCLF